MRQNEKESTWTYLLKFFPGEDTICHTAYINMIRIFSEENQIVQLVL